GAPDPGRGGDTAARRLASGPLEAEGVGEAAPAPEDRPVRPLEARGDPTLDRGRLPRPATRRSPRPRGGRHPGRDLTRTFPGGRDMPALFKLRITRYLDEQGRRVPKGTPGARVVRERSRKWYGEYRDAEGVTRRVP